MQNSKIHTADEEEIKGEEDNSSVDDNGIINNYVRYFKRWRLK